MKLSSDKSFFLNPTIFSPVTSTNVGINLKNFLTFSFNPFCHTDVKFQGHTLYQPKIVVLESRLP